jgi:hypothetical protein
MPSRLRELCCSTVYGTSVSHPALIDYSLHATISVYLFTSVLELYETVK